jgi:5-methylcytosine-specific restriction enzyme subunit McrC
MRPDLVLYRHGDPVLVADIKYKLTDAGLGRSTDYYQLLAYCEALGLSRGVLLYAADIGDPPGVETVVTNSGLSLGLESVRLGGTAAAIESSISEVAHSLTSHSR